MRNASRVFSIILLVGAFSMLGVCTAFPKAEPAKITISGAGWFRDRELRASLEMLLATERGSVVDAGALEDAVFLLFSAITEDGFLHPSIVVEANLQDGLPWRASVSSIEDISIPRELAATSVHFVLNPGVRYFISDVVIRGSHVLTEAQARAYFLPSTALFVGKAARRYTPSSLQRSLQALQATLRQRGYADAQVAAEKTDEDEATGAVRLQIGIREGARWEVSALRLVGSEPSPLAFSNLEQRWSLRPWSEFWRQDVAEDIRRSYFLSGYPDVKVRVEVGAASGNDSVKRVAATAQIEAGKPVRVGQVRFRGNLRTKASVLQRRVRIHPGDLLDPLMLEKARFQLARLDVFESVETSYEPSTGEVRDVVFLLKEAQRWEFNTTLGFGSYDKLRVGFEVKQRNVFGRAQESRLDLLQSFKTTRGDYTYTVPEIFGESIDGSARLFGLRRQEQAFLRQEFGIDLTFKRPLPWLGVEAMAGYTLQRLQNQQNQLATRAVDLGQVTVGALEFGVTRERRDHPLRPTRGYRFYIQTELASRLFGGAVDYQRLEAGTSFHYSWGHGQSIHIGLRHGAVAQLGTHTVLPVNKRFYPGGDDTIRGYNEGEASPRGADGRFVGAKSYALGNFEFEQAFTAKWSGVIFLDALGTAATLRDYPFGERLYSVGLGVRYYTLLGPVRVEYGRNLNPRRDDPRGAIHLALGIPF